MHRSRRGLVVAGAALTLCSVVFAGASPAVARARYVVGLRAVASGGTWGSAKEVPGSAQLNQGGFANITSVSCASAGNCSAGGFYVGGSHHQQALVVNETNGTWRTAKEVPGTAALNQGGLAQLNSISCASAGNCSAGGFYAAHGSQAFVVNETNGTWHTAKEVPGTAALNQGGGAYIESVSCAAAGDCSATGDYTDSSGNTQVFVVNETNGTWGTAEEAPGAAALNQGTLADLFSVSCGSAGNCSAGGDYTDASGNLQAWVITETNGTWGTAEEVPGTAALNQGGFAETQSVSCASPGNCSAGGNYADAGNNSQVFVINETNGTWGTAEEVPGSAALNSAGLGGLDTVSCASAGNCSAGGSLDRLFVVNETNGTWGTAKVVPGIAALDSGGEAALFSVSCASAGNCAAGGFYTDSFSHEQAFVVNETNGTWRGAIEVPGTVVLNQGGSAGISSVSCASAGHCSAGGSYTDSSLGSQAFVVNET
jgi:hypothetical protein